ncbi:MAG: glycoside hydrolase family 127 protein [Verrucomicrobia bacterium]|nr:glycoside hydrolase family 127 protein [Verrucomicrobiota bacterium]
MKTTLALIVAALSLSVTMADREPIPWRTPARLADAVELPSPSAMLLEGFLGFRVQNNAMNRLLLVNEEPLLAGFRNKPGSHPWIGEHVGKWLHAATLAWSYTGDPNLRAKIDRVARELVATQEPDGYLGTYVPGQRFGLYPGADWDVWVHKYNLIGLLTYHQYTGDEPSLEACRRVGNLLIQTFGPDKKSIVSAGTHVGMAATSVLEPVVLLYRATGDPRYLEFARYLVSAYDDPNGPKIISSLIREKSVARTANAKGYELLSNLVGLCELARATGERQWLTPVLLAWEDIKTRRLYLTGSATQGEHFHDDFELPNHPSANIGETCVATTWIQLNSQLLRLTGEARFADALEQTFINHLAAAQRPDGAHWCYFTALEGTKPYGPGINCCVSSGPRGMALVPQHACLIVNTPDRQPPILALALFEMWTANLQIEGTSVRLDHFADVTKPGHYTLTVRTPKPIRLGFKIRTPDWARPLYVRFGKSQPRTVLRDGWTILPAQRWKDGDQLHIQLTLQGRILQGTHGNQGHAAALWGPAVLAYDEAYNQDLGPISAIGFANPPNEPTVLFASDPDGSAIFKVAVRSARVPGIHRANFVLFADAGSASSRYRVWLPAPDSPLPRNPSVFGFGPETRSRRGNVSGSITDGEPDSFVVTFDGQPQTEAWFAVHTDQPTVVRSVSFAHGHTFHDGGWFDTQAGKPEIQIQRAKDGPWITVARLESYPATTARDAATLKPGQLLTQHLPKAEPVFGLRILGKPASGDNPNQAFASCAELGASN